MLDLTKPVTQAEFGVLVGVSQKTVSDFMRAAALDSTTPVGHMLIAYCARLRESAAGRGTESDGGEYIREKTRLARSQRIAQELKNAEWRKEFKSVHVLVEVLSYASQSIAAKLEALPGTLMKVAPSMPDAARDAIAHAIAKARNEWVAETAVLEVRTDPSLLPDDESLEESELMEGE